MKILAGSLKGRKLYPRGRKIPARPISAKAKGVLFNVLSPYFFEGFRFLDLFAGTGSLSMEALSRGAGEAHAVENHPLCLKIIRQNASLLGQGKKLILHKRNVFSFLKQARDFEARDDSERQHRPDLTSYLERGTPMTRDDSERQDCPDSPPVLKSAKKLDPLMAKAQGITEQSDSQQMSRGIAEKHSKTFSIKGGAEGQQFRKRVFSKPIEPFDIIVADPPFALKAGDQILTELQESRLTKKGSFIFVETGAGERLKSHYCKLCLFSQKFFSDKKLWFYEQR